MASIITVFIGLSFNALFPGDRAQPQADGFGAAFAYLNIPFANHHPCPPSLPVFFKPRCRRQLFRLNGLVGKNTVIGFFEIPGLFVQ
jgi:hypothetical protein